MSKIALKLKSVLVTPIDKCESPQGLFYYPNFLTVDEGISLTTELDGSQKWTGVSSSENSRRVIHYGYTYPYGGGNLIITDPIPSTYTSLLSRVDTTIKDNEAIKKLDQLDQLIINQYLPGQNIAPHIDDPSKFGPVVVCFTIGSGVSIDFTRDGFPTYSIYVEPNSLYVMSGESRSLWRHSIAKRKNDVVLGKTIPRGVRRSLTFRSVNENTIKKTPSVITKIKISQKQ